MPDIQRAIVKGHLFGLVSFRNMFVGSTTTVAPDRDSTAPLEYVQRFYTPILGSISNAVTFETLQCQKFVAGVWEDYEEVTMTISAIGNQPVMPNSSAIVLVGKGGGRLGHGRKFISGLLQANIVGNSMTAGALAAFSAALVNYITSYTTTAGSSFAPGFLDKTGNFHLFISGYVDSLIGSMRRRKPGLGI